MPEQPLLSVLIPALEWRDWHLIVEEITRQRYEWGLPVEILVELDAGQMTSGVKRQILTKRALGKYICFVDDDDQVSPDYLKSIYEGCVTDVDLVIFNLLIRVIDENRTELWRFNYDGDDGNIVQMLPNHLCAWRKDIAHRIAWCPYIGYGDDQLWYRPLVGSRQVRTSYRIDKVLYFYLLSRANTVAQSEENIQTTSEYVGDGLRCFINPQGQIFIEHGPPQVDELTVVVFDHECDILEYPLKNLNHFYTIYMS